MKILLLIETLAKAGAERVVVDNAIALKKRGIECEVAILFKKNELVEELLNQNIKVHILNLSYKWNIIEGGYKLLRLLKEEQINIIHAHLFFSTFYAAIIKFANKKIKTVSTFHNLAFNVYPPNTAWKKIRLKLESYLMRNYFDINTACSNAVNLHYSEHLKLKNVSTIYNGFNLDKFKLSMEPKEVDVNKLFHSFRPDIIAITPGRMTKEKGHIFLIDAIKNKFRNKNIGFIFVGSGPISKNIKKRISDENLENQIIVIDAIEQVRLFKMIKSSNIVILPSISEGFPMIVGESMALGKAIISTNISGIPELIESGRSGLLVPSKNVSELEKAISSLVKDRKLMKKFELNALQDIKKFNIENTTSQWIKIYEGLINAK